MHETFFGRPRSLLSYPARPDLITARQAFKEEKKVRNQAGTWRPHPGTQPFKVKLALTLTPIGCKLFTRRAKYYAAFCGFPVCSWVFQRFTRNPKNRLFLPQG